MPLHLDYRPQDFQSMFGNKATIAALEAIFGRESDYPHAILLQGPKGTGKTTIARIIRMILDCNETDFSEVNVADDKGIATARRIIEDMKYRPMHGSTRIFLLDEFHMANKILQNALLKPLEDCPAHVYFLLCTTDPMNLIGTLRSRCHTFETQNLNRSDGIALLKDVLVKEKVDWISEPILKKIYDASEGCPRESLKILDQVVDLQTEEEMEAAICSMSYEETQINDLWNVLLSAKPQWNKVRKILENMDLSNHEGLRKAMLTRMSNLMLKSDNPHAATIFDCFKDPFYNTLKAGFINACYQSVVMLDLD